jgi:ATP-binding cassette subfamily B multidrug efflux pump
MEKKSEKGTSESGKSETGLRKPDNLSMIKRMRKWVIPHTRTFILCLVLLLVTTFIKIIGPVIIQKAVDNYIVPGNFRGLVVLLCSYILVLAFGFFANYIEIVKLETVGQFIIANIKNAAFKHIISLNLSYFDRSTTGKLVSRVENDSNAMKILFTSVLTNVLGSIILLVGMIAVMAFFYSSKLALSILFILPFMAIGAYFFDKFMSPRLVEIRKLIADVTSYITEIIHGIAIIQIFGQEKRVLDELETRSLKKFKNEKFTAIMFNGFFNLLFFMEAIGTVIIAGIGTEMVIKKTLTIGSLILFINFIRNFFMPIIQLSGQFNEFQKGIAGASRIFDLLDTVNTIPEAVQPQEIPAKEKGINIEFRNVWFRYDENSEWVLKDLSFYCPKGEHWAIVGPTGSGKTTIISLLLKFYTPQQGEILLNGVNINDISGFELRNTIGLVLQDNILFPGTIMQNLTLNQSKYSGQEVKSLMQALSIDSVINRLKDGYDTELNENVSNLSSGEKQLISFGRALLKNPAILVFDEATSNIDPEMENKIKMAMNALIEGRTALIIAHRLSTIQNADKIMVLKQGHLIELGNHSELVDFGGFYSELNTLQVG